MLRLNGKSGVRGEASGIRNNGSRPTPDASRLAPAGAVAAAPDEATSEAVSELFQELPPVVARGLVYVLLGLLLVAGLFAFLVTVPELVAARATVVPQGLVRQL